MDLRYGIPQGLCLGPLLFAVYASAPFDVIEKHPLTVHCYSDDSQLNISFSPKAHSAQAAAVPSIKQHIRDIREWMYQEFHKTVARDPLFADDCPLSAKTEVTPTPGKSLLKGM